MPLLLTEPMFQEHLSVVGVLERVGPCRLGEGSQKPIRHFPKAPDNFERFAGTLMKISKRVCPSGGVQLHEPASGFGDERAALHVTRRFAVGQMVNDLMDAPAIREGAIEPHLLGKLAQGRRKQRRAPLPKDSSFCRRSSRPITPPVAPMASLDARINRRVLHEL